MATTILPRSNGAHNPTNAAQISQFFVTFQDLLHHGDDTAAALALGDMWAILPTPARQTVTTYTRQLSQRTAGKIWPAFADLMHHGELNAAALVFGDAWLTLPAPDRARVVEAMKAQAQQ